MSVVTAVVGNVLIAILVIMAFFALVAFAIIYPRWRKIAKTLEKTPPYRPAALRPKPQEWSDDGLTLTWIGHSSILMNLRGRRILTDPVLGRRVGVHLAGPVQIGPRRYVGPALLPEEIGPVDLIILSHAHLDHLDVPSLAALKSPHTHVITARGTGHLVPTGFASVQEIGWGETIDALGVHITGFEVRHWGRRFPWNKDHSYNGYAIACDGMSVLFPGDTAYMQMSHIAELSGDQPFDVACVPIGAYRPTSFERSHCTPEQAWQMFQQSGARNLVPIHWNTFILSQEPIREPFERLEAAAGDEIDRIVIRQQGETFWVSDPH